MIVAAIDLGTNTFQMLIAERHANGAINTIHKERRFVKIGEGGINKGFIAPAACQRALDTLKDYSRIAQEMGASKILAVGTSALRNASNGPALMEQVRQETGLSIKIIDGHEEAMLIYRGVRHTVNMKGPISLIMDIGGGSVEFILCSTTQVFWKHSFEIGAQRLYDSFHHSEPMASTDLEELNQFLHKTLEPLVQALPSYPPAELIGAAGAFGTLWNLQNKGDVPLRDEPITLSQFQYIFSELLVKNREERLAIPGMQPARVDMIVVASCLIEQVLALTGLQDIRISGGALKEGLMLSAFEA